MNCVIVVYYLSYCSSVLIGSKWLSCCDSAMANLCCAWYFICFLFLSCYVTGAWFNVIYVYFCCSFLKWHLFYMCPVLSFSALSIHVNVLFFLVFAWCMQTEHVDWNKYFSKYIVMSYIWQISINIRCDHTITGAWVAQ